MTDDDTDYEIPEKFEDEKWTCDWKPTFKPDWRENGTIHLDGEKDFGIDTPADEVIESFQNICEQVGGLCTHQPDDQTFEVTAQFGELLYRMHYDDEGEITQIDVRILENNGLANTENGTSLEADWEPEYTRYSYDVDELVEFHEEVVDTLMEMLDNGDAEWTIEKDTDRTNIHDL